MTPSQIDHLRRIDAHLANLLLTAEKRTPGKYEHDGPYSIVGQDEAMSFPVIAECGCCVAHVIFNESAGDSKDGSWSDAAFIAACAGNAEAGWKATRLAIKTLLEYTGPLTPQIEREYAKEKLGEIIALFPNV